MEQSIQNSPKIHLKLYIYSSCGSFNHKESKALKSNSVQSYRQHCVPEISTAASYLVCYFYFYGLFGCESEMMMMIVAVVVVIK